MIRITVLSINQDKLGNDVVDIAKNDRNAFNDKLASAGECGIESGLSIIVETEHEKFLFDTGDSNLFLKNAKLLGLNLDELDTVILSHGHDDHSNGLSYLTNGKRVIMHPDGFIPRYSLRRGDYEIFPLTPEESSKRFNFILTDKPYDVYDDVVFLGEIPRKIDFEGIGNLSTTLDAEHKQIDHIKDDSAIAIKTEKGLIVMSGCGHSGICNIIEYAKEVTGENRIYAILGGFHLVTPIYNKTSDDMDIQIEKTIEYFKKNNIQHFYLGHCIHEPTYTKFEDIFGKERIHRLYSGGDFEIR